MKLTVTPSTRSDKRFMAILTDGKKSKSIHFGARNGSTYIDHGNDDLRRAYIARHSVNEDWNTVNAGSLSRYILWEERNLDAAVRAFKSRFGLS